MHDVNAANGPSLGRSCSPPLPNMTQLIPIAACCSYLDRNTARFCLLGPPELTGTGGSGPVSSVVLLLLCPCCSTVLPLAGTGLSYRFCCTLSLLTPATCNCPCFVPDTMVLLSLLSKSLLAVPGCTAENDSAAIAAALGGGKTKNSSMSMKASHLCCLKCCRRQP